MRNALESVSRGYEIYHARRDEYITGQQIPFRVASMPYPLTSDEGDELLKIGKDTADFFQAADELYRTRSEVRALLNRGKPEIFLGDSYTKYLFVRPDLIITDAGFKICEIETSPFGLGLSHILTQAANNQGFETMVSAYTLPAYVHTRTPTEGTLIYSKKTQSYAGQITFLADKVFSSPIRQWGAGRVDQTIPQGTVYRSFYLSEYLTDPAVETLLETHNAFLPSLTPHMEEKAVLALLYDKRYEQFFANQLGQAAFTHLRSVVPPTWIVGEEEYFSPGMPQGMQSSVELATLSNAKRTFVLKASGFSQTSSWSEGVSLLHKKSRDTSAELLQKAATDTEALYIVQEFTKPSTLKFYYEEQREEVPMMARVRITPYFTPEGKLLTAKLTACEATTDLIHASSTSINTALSHDKYGRY